jgi:hypothetical protein
VHLRNNPTGNPNTVQAAALAAGAVVPANSPFKLMSFQTGQYCKVVSVGAVQQLQCNADEAYASTFTYNAGGLFHQVITCSASWHVLAGLCWLDSVLAWQPGLE